MLGMVQRNVDLRKAHYKEYCKCWEWYRGTLTYVKLIIKNSVNVGNGTAER